MNEEPIVRFELTNTETGQTWSGQRYILPTNAELTCIVKVLTVDHYLHEDGSLQIAADCRALDNLGGVYPLHLEYHFDAPADANETIQTLGPDLIASVRGQFSAILDPDLNIILYHPHLSPLPPQFSEEEVRRVFSFNSWISTQHADERNNPLPIDNK